jgi:Na+/pantothenate symporter
MPSALLVKPPPSCIFPARGAVFVLRIIAGDLYWNKANDCDCAINMFISPFPYILKKQWIACVPCFSSVRPS